MDVDQNQKILRKKSSLPPAFLGLGEQMANARKASMMKNPMQFNARRETLAGML